MGYIVFALFYLFCLLHAASARPLCTDSRAPFTAKSPLAFCSYNGTVCCDAKEDLGLGKRFRDMNVSDPACGSLLKSILCALNYCNAENVPSKLPEILTSDAERERSSWRDRELRAKAEMELRARADIEQRARAEIELRAPKSLQRDRRK